MSEIGQFWMNASNCNYMYSPTFWLYSNFVFSMRKVVYHCIDKAGTVLNYLVTETASIFSNEQLIKTV